MEKRIAVFTPVDNGANLINNGESCKKMKNPSTVAEKKDFSKILFQLNFELNFVNFYV